MVAMKISIDRVSLFSPFVRVVSAGLVALAIAAGGCVPQAVGPENAGVGAAQVQRAAAAASPIRAAERRVPMRAVPVIPPDDKAAPPKGSDASGNRLESAVVPSSMEIAGVSVTVWRPV